MYHTIEFHTECKLALQVSRKQPLERVILRKGTRLQAQIRPYVTETEEGFIEMADLFFGDGTATTRVPFAHFSFVD